MASAIGETRVDVADIRKEIKAVEQSVAAAVARLEASLRRANEAVERLETQADNRTGAVGATDLDERIAKAHKNAARVEQEGNAALATLQKQADATLAKLKRRLKLVDEKLTKRR